MSVRPARNEDIAAILSLLNSAEELKESDREYDENYVKANLNNPINVVLVLQESEIDGVLIAEVWKDKKYAYIANIVVAEDKRRAGVASLLYDYFEDVCVKEGMDVINGFVKETNVNMQEWMAKKGFSRGELFFYYEKKSKNGIN